MTLPPLQFEPLIKRALWGGTRLGTALGKQIGSLTDAAESWELFDVPGAQNVVRHGPFAGRSLRDLMQSHPVELCGTRSRLDRFPIMVKFLDAREQLSVQVHPQERVRDQDGSLRRGKTEAWVVLAADPGSRMSLGLQHGVTESQLRRAIADGDVSQCLHSYEPRVGDCFLLEPGTVHALGGGILVAEIQEPTDITYRLYDWNRRDAQGNPRELHLEIALQNTDFQIGPVFPKTPHALATSRGERLVNCSRFCIDRYSGEQLLQLGRDKQSHVLVLLAGSAQYTTVGQAAGSLRVGETLLVPACRDDIELRLAPDAILLDTYVPESSPA